MDPYTRRRHHTRCMCMAMCQAAFLPSLTKQLSCSCSPHKVYLWSQYTKCIWHQAWGQHNITNISTFWCNWSLSTFVATTHTQSSDTALLQLTVAGVARVNFNNTRQQTLLMSVQRVLQSNSYSGVTVTVYTVYEDSQLQWAWHNYVCGKWTALHVKGSHV